MREIKFRVWFAGKHWYGIPAIHYRDGKISRIDLNHDDSDFDPTPDTWTGPDDFVLEQFTGLKDRNGKEIYDGDILEFTHQGEKFRTDPVKYDPGIACFSGAIGLGEHVPEDLFLQNDFPETYEVIGTIHDKGEV